MPFLAIPAVAVGISAAATAASAGAAIMAANQKAQSDRYNAQIAANDAQVATWNRQMQEQQLARESLMASQEGATEASRLEMKNGALEATNINNAASAGLALSGSTKDAILSTAMNGEMNSLDAQYRGQVQSYEHQVQESTTSWNDTVQADKYKDQSVLFGAEASNDMTSGLVSAGGSILGGAARTVDTGDRLGVF